MCLLTPVSVRNQNKNLPMHDRLFAEDAPAPSYPASFRPKVLRRLGDWTFYSTPTRGELELMNQKTQLLAGRTGNEGTLEQARASDSDMKRLHLPTSAQPVSRKEKEVVLR